MKTNCVKPRNRWSLGRLVSASALLLLGVTAMGQALPKSPVGTWDCVMSGPREGLALMTFLANGTFVNDEILVPKQPQTSVQHNDVRNSGDDGRFPTGILATNTPLPAHVNIFGWEGPKGQWGFDSRGRVIGYFYEISAPTYSTNALPGLTNLDVQLYSTPVTNGGAADEFCVTQTVGINTDGGALQPFTNVTTCYVVTAFAVTNQLSFVGTVVPGKRLSLLVTSPAGKVTFSGVPDVPQTDLSGNYYGIEREGYLWYTEFFTLTRFSPSSNRYYVDGAGPAYTFSGVAYVCPQKKLATAVSILPVFGAEADPPLIVRSVVGPCNLKRLNGALHGLKGQDIGDTQRLTYSLQHQYP